jgi:hypothetical protein
LIKFEFQTLKKRNLSMGDYIAHATTLVDTIVVVGASISNEELSLHILGGLGSKY